MKRIKFNTHRVGINCGSSPLRDMLAFYGIELTEPMCFGIGSGLNFVYHHGDEENPDKHWRSPFYIVTGRTLAPYVETCSTLGVKLNLYRTEDSEYAWTEVKELIDRGVPVVCDIDREDFLASINQNNIMTDKYGYRFGGHKTILTGYDEQENIALIVENMLKDEIEIPLDVFKRSRNSAQLYPSRNEWYTIETPVQILDLTKAIKIGIIKNIQNMKYPVFKGYGLSALDWWKEEFQEWPVMMEEERFEASVWMLFIQCEPLSGGGMYRKLYSRFLNESSIYIPELDKAALHYRKLSKVWTKLITGLFLEDYSVKREAFERERMVAQIEEIYNMEYEGIAMLEEVAEKWL